jgi:hypothetical protein
MKIDIVITRPDVTSVGWCILKRRPRGNEDENGHLISDPDEFLFSNKNQYVTSVTVINNGIGMGIPFQSWWPFTDALNSGYPGANQWLSTYEAVFFNNDQGPEREIDKTKPVNIRSSSSGGNLKAYYLGTQTSTHIQIVAFDYRYPELASGKAFNTDPHLFTYPSAINLAGEVSKVANGIDVFVPQVERKEYGLWANKNDVIFLDQKPSNWTMADVLGR